MMQEATDYLGERQRADYKRWKADIVARIEEIETI
jgi:origin recognition complex subunit 6